MGIVDGHVIFDSKLKFWMATVLVRTSEREPHLLDFSGPNFPFVLLGSKVNDVITIYFDNDEYDLLAWLESRFGPPPQDWAVVGIYAKAICNVQVSERALVCIDLEFS